MKLTEIESELPKGIVDSKSVWAKMISEGDHTSSLRATRVPRRYWHSNRANTVRRKGYPIDPMLEACLGGESAFISGPAGTGKTRAAVIAMNLWLATQDLYLLSLSGTDVSPPPPMPVFASPSDIILEIKASWSNPSLSEQDVLREYLVSPFLILDDIGAYGSNAYGRDILYCIIDKRYGLEAQTVVTSNFDLDAISRDIDDRIASRLCEMGPIFAAQCEDFRTTKGGDRCKK